MSTNIVRHPHLLLKLVGALLHGQPVSTREKESSKALLLYIAMSDFRVEKSLAVGQGLD